MCLQEPMKARVLMCDVIRQTCMTRNYSEMNENTFSSHFPDHCVLHTCFECSLTCIFKPACFTLSEQAQN